MRIKLLGHTGDLSVVTDIRFRNRFVAIDFTTTTFKVMVVNGFAVAVVSTTFQLSPP